MTTKAKGESIRQKVTTISKKLAAKYRIGQESMSWSVYPIETICAEKLHALISHGDQNSRSKDVHDLAIFLPKADRKTLKKAIKNCFEFRETEVPDSFFDEVQKLNTSRLQKGWSSAVTSVPSAGSFEQAFNKMLKAIEEIETKWS